MLQPESTVRCVMPFVYILARFLIAWFLKVTVDLQFVRRHIRQFDNRAPNPVLLPSPQIFAYLAFAASSLLVVLRMCSTSSSWVAFVKLMETVRIAIWDRKKIIVAFATG